MPLLPTPPMVCPALTTCPQCSGRLRKLFNSVGVVFKGSGFYRTDSRAAAKGSGEGKKSEGSESSAPPAKATGETKSSSAEKTTAAAAS